jgi:hypothetical protein
LAHAFVVRVPFPRRDGPGIYKKGEIVGHPGHAAGIRASEHHAFGHSVRLPDDHPAVLPHLNEGHPAVTDFMANVRAGQRAG